MKQMSVGSTLPFIRYGTRAVRHYGRGGGGSGSDIRDSTTGEQELDNFGTWDSMNIEQQQGFGTFEHNIMVASSQYRGYWIVDMNWNQTH